jgi:hypothetical protein
MDSLVSFYYSPFFQEVNGYEIAEMVKIGQTSFCVWMNTKEMKFPPVTRACPFEQEFSIYYYVKLILHAHVLLIGKKIKKFHRTREVL